MSISRRIFGMQNAAGFVLKAALSLVAIALLCLPATAQFQYERHTLYDHEPEFRYY